MPGRGAPWQPNLGFLYREFIAPLVRAGYRVIVPDMIGFGLSESPCENKRTAWTVMSANLIALLPQLGLTALTLVCHDWGGPTGLIMR